MRTEVTVRVDDVLAQLQPMAKQHNVERLSELSAIVPDFEIEAEVDAEAAAGEAGYVNADRCREGIIQDLEANISDRCREGIIQDLEANISDLRDGLQALADGDRSMAAILLTRAFDEWDDARSAVEQVLLTSTTRDHRQPMLLVA